MVAMAGPQVKRRQGSPAQRVPGHFDAQRLKGQAQQQKKGHRQGRGSGPAQQRAALVAGGIEVKEGAQYPGPGERSIEGKAPHSGGNPPADAQRHQDGCGDEGRKAKWIGQDPPGGVVLAQPVGYGQQAQSERDQGRKQPLRRDIQDPEGGAQQAAHGRYHQVAKELGLDAQGGEGVDGQAHG